jgi:uncharacterized membrane protein YeaQ/YmgE (transglycosylase-associated protein family)
MFKILAWIILGLLSGAVAKMIVPGRQGGGILATAGLGIGGAFVGGMVHNLITTGGFNFAKIINDKNVFDLGSIITAVLGAVVVIFIWGLVMGRAEN